MPVRLKRAYEPAEGSDGERVLVERLWPRGVRKDELRIDAWLKDLAPSAELRKWYAHEPERWPEFRRRYASELARPEVHETLADLARRGRSGVLTLVFAARDAAHSSAEVLKEELERVV